MIAITHRQRALEQLRKDPDTPVATLAEMTNKTPDEFQDWARRIHLYKSLTPLTPREMALLLTYAPFYSLETIAQHLHRHWRDLNAALYRTGNPSPLPLGAPRPPLPAYTPPPTMQGAIFTDCPRAIADKGSPLAEMPPRPPTYTAGKESK